MLAINNQAPNSTTNTIAFWINANQAAARTRLNLLRCNKHQDSLLDNDFSNFSVSVDWLATQNNKEDMATIFIAYLEILIPYLRKKGHNQKLADWCSSGLDACELTHSNPAMVYLARGDAQFALGQWERAYDSFQAAAKMSVECDANVYHDAIYAMGRTQLNRGNYRNALMLLSQAEKLYSACGNIRAALTVHSELAAYYLNRRNIDKALEMYLEIEQRQSEIDEDRPVSNTLLMIGVTYRQKGDYEKAFFYLSELYDFGERNNELSVIATAAHHIAWTYLALGQVHYARRLCGQAITLYEKSLDRRGLSDAYEQLGAILIEEKKINDASQVLVKSIEIRQQIGNLPGVVSSMRRLALVDLMNRKYPSAISSVIKILFHYQQMNMLSRYRVARLIYDFVDGMRKAIIYRFGVDIEHGKKEPISLMENFSRSIIHNKDSQS